MERDEFFGTAVATRQIGPYALCVRDYGPSTRLPFHTHSEPFVTVVLAGGFREQSPGISVACGAHQMVIHEPDVRHRNHFLARRTRCLIVQGGRFRRTVGLTSPAMAGIAVKLHAEFRRPDTLSPLVLDALMSEMFVTAERLRDEAGVPRWLHEVHAIIDRRFDEPLTLQSLARWAEVHDGHLARAFRRQYGLTVGERIRERRVAYVRQRLESKSSLQAIAQDAGFADQSHMTRTFRLATGLTPARYRKTLFPF